MFFAAKRPAWDGTPSVPPDESPLLRSTHTSQPKRGSSTLTRPPARPLAATRQIALWGVVLPLVMLATSGCRECGKAVTEPEAQLDVVTEPGVSHVSASRRDLPRATGDLSEIVERGTLRVLVASVEEAFLPRSGSPASIDRALVRELAERRGLDLQFILVPEHASLIPMLLDGAGDLVASQLTVTEAREKEVAFTWPLFSVEEVLVASKDLENPPSSKADLSGMEVHVRAGSSYMETLLHLVEAESSELLIVPVEEHLDTETIVYDVSTGRRPLTVADSHLLDTIETYNTDVKRLFAIREGRNIAWAVRKESVELKAVLDAFLIEKALTADAQTTFTGDLDEIRQRGRLRVLTRNNPVTYFLHRGSPLGFDYTLAEMLARSLGVRLEMVVPPSRDLLIPWLLDGRGDIVAASMTITEERAQRVAFSRPYLLVDEVLVGRSDSPDFASLHDMAGLEIHVRRSSSYFDTLSALADEVPDLRVVEAPEDLETEALIESVGTGKISYTVADTHILQAELAYRDDVRPILALTGEPGASPPPPERVGIEGGKEIAFALRPENEALREAVDVFVRGTYRGVEYNMARRRYFEQHRRIAGAERPGTDGSLSLFDPLIRRYSRQYSLDWRLMAALAYQESRFDPEAESWVGALGLFQVMPSTGAMLGFSDLRDPEEGTHAGIMYMHRRLSGLDSRIPFEERVRFALAGYNCGIGHVADARRLAAAKGWDPDLWFDNVEKAMLLLMQPRYHRQARHGYVRGSEPVKYVASIQNRYGSYVQLIPDTSPEEAASK